MKRSINRAGRDVYAKARGRTPYRFLFTLRPICVEGVPSSYKQLLLVWQRAGKIQMTHVQSVGEVGVLRFDDDTVLQQTTTMYAVDDNKFRAKDYELKLQAVTTHHGVDKTKTIARYLMDFAQLCQLDAQPVEEALEVHMKPFGILRAYASTKWLANVTVANSDAMSDFSFATPRSDAHTISSEQDLSGFDDSENRHAQPSKSAAAAKSTPPMEKPKPKQATAHTRHRSTLPEITADNLNDTDDLRHTSAIVAAQRAASVPNDTVLTKASRPPKDDAASQSSQKDDRAKQVSFQDSPPPVATPAAASTAAPQPTTPAQTRTWSQWLRIYPQQSPLEPEPEALSAAAPYDSGSDLAVINNVSDIQTLRSLAKQLLQQRDEHMLAAQQLRRHDDVVSAKANKAGGGRRVGGGSGADAALNSDVMADLIQAKVQLADADYTIHELRQELCRERSRCRSLAAKVTTLQARHDLMQHYRD